MFHWSGATRIYSVLAEPHSVRNIPLGYDVLLSFLATHRWIATVVQYLGVQQTSICSKPMQYSGISGSLLQLVTCQLLRALHRIDTFLKPQKLCTHYVQVSRNRKEGRWPWREWLLLSSFLIQHEKSSLLLGRIGGVTKVGKNLDLHKGVPKLKKLLQYRNDSSGLQATKECPV